MLETFLAGVNGRLGRVRILALSRGSLYQWFAYDRLGRMVAHGSAGSVGYARTDGQIELVRYSRRLAETTNR